uniref:Ie-1 n=1 Tax=Cnaphalocrocis medinalis granulovirus TaxID=1750712 RepID=A0A109P793_9BBAC|nr:ie-1 [Cnaphalocrocis medinalis granulovirus]
MENIKWMKHFKTTTYHMFLCHRNGLMYVKTNVFIRRVHTHILQLYGNAYELTLKDCKFTSQATSSHRGCTSTKIGYRLILSPKDFEYPLVAQMMLMNLIDGHSLQHHIIEAMINTLFVGVTNEDIQSIKNKLSDHTNTTKIEDIKQNYSWKSENRKIKNLFNAQCVSSNDSNNNLINMFDILYRDVNVLFKFRRNVYLYYDSYISDFKNNVLQLKRSVTGYTDPVSNLKLVVKDMALLMYSNTTPAMLEFKNVEGDHIDAEHFLVLSKQNPHGDVILNMKLQHTNTVKFRLCCFKIDDVHVWINSMVYNTPNKLCLENIINKHKWGKHYIIGFSYMYNAYLSKMYSDVIKLVIRYILSSRQIDLIQTDIASCPKLTYSYIGFA